MTFKDKIKFVRQNMKKNRMRIFMTVLATAMASAFLIVLASVGFGLHDTLLKDIMEQDTINEISIYGYENEAEYRDINDQDISYFETLDNVRSVTRRNYLAQAVHYQINGFELSNEYSESQFVHFPSEQKAGMTLAEGDYPSKANEVVVGYHFVDQLLPTGLDPEEVYDEQGNRNAGTLFTEDIIGQTLSFEIEKYDEDDNVETKAFEVVVVGVTEEPSREWAVDTTIYMSELFQQEIEAFTEARNGNPYAFEVTDQEAERTYEIVKIYTHSLQQVEDLTTHLSEENYYAYSVANEIRQINMLFSIAKAGLIFIGTIAVLIASIGIFNTMTMAVTERAPDIGIMKAIGANPKTIKQIFLLESTYIGMIGALIGTAISYLISFAVNLGIPLILEAVFDDQLPEGLKFSSIPWSLVAIAITICLVVTIISGSRPAKKATQIDVLKAMRRDI